MTSRDELLAILNSIQQGTITPTEGLRLIHSLNRGDIIDESPGDQIPVTSPTPEDTPEQADESTPAKTYQVVIPVVGPTIDSSIPASPAVSQSTPAGTTSSSYRVEGQPMGEKEAERDIAYWKRWWLWPFWAGVATTLLGALIMYAGYEAAGFGFFFWFAWLPFFLGVIVIALSWQNQALHWLHIRVHQKPGEKPGHISISLPLPLGVAGWFLRNFGHLIPGLREQNLTGNDIADILSTIQANLSAENPFYVHVNDEGGEEVEVYIG